MQPGEHIQVGRRFASINNISGSPRLRTMKVLCDQQGGDIAARMWQDVRGCARMFAALGHGSLFALAAPVAVVVSVTFLWPDAVACFA